MPDWREPLPDLPLPPNGQVRLGAGGRVVDRDHAGRDPLAEAERVLARARVDRRREPVAVAVGQLHRLVEGRERGDADDRAERLGRVDLVVGGHADDQRRVVEDPRVRDRRRSPRAGSSAVIRPCARRAVDRVVVAHQPEPVLEALGEALVDHRPVEDVRRSGRRSATTTAARRAWRRTRRGPTRARSRCRATCSAGPRCRSRRTARPRRRGRRRRRPSRPSGSCRRAPGTATAGGARTARRSREPTALEPVKPTLSTRPSLERLLEARERVRRPTACTTFSTPPGTPPAWNSLASASPSAALYSAGFQTTALPHRIAGTRYQAGTATGKLPAVMIAATPTGMRNVKSCLLGISDGTVCPYRRRPSPRKKSHVSTISWTSPSASGYGLPISRVTSRGERLLVGLDQPADLRDHAPAGRRRHRGPLLLRGARGARGVDERRRVAEQRPRRRPRTVRGGVGGGQAAAGSVGARLAADRSRRRWRGAAWRSSGHAGTVGASARTMRRRTPQARTARQRGLEASRSPGCRPGRRRAGRPRRARRGRRAAPARRAARRGVSPRAATRTTGAAPAPAISAVSSARSALRGCAPGSSSDDVRRTGRARAPRPSRRPRCGRPPAARDANAGSAGVLVELALPAVGRGGRELGAGDHRDGAVQRARERLGLAVLGAVRAPLRGERLGQRRGRLDLVAHATARRRPAPPPPARATSE